MGKLQLGAVLVVGGCVSGSFDKRMGQDQAEAIVWRSAYAMTDSAPEVEWIPVDSFNIGGQAEEGFTWAGWKIQVVDGDPSNPVQDAASDGHWTIHSTSYAHELMHYRTFVQTGDVDALHLRGDWHLADFEARDMLRDAGL